MRRPSVSYVIPKFNGAENIEHAMLVGRRIAENPRIRMIRHEENRKLGGALKTGFAAG